MSEGLCGSDQRLDNVMINGMNHFTNVCCHQEIIDLPQFLFREKLGPATEVVSVLWIVKVLSDYYRFSGVCREGAERMADRRLLCHRSRQKYHS